MPGGRITLPAVLVALALAVVTSAAAAFTAREVDRRESSDISERSASVTAALDRRVDLYTEKLFGIRAAVAVERGLPGRRAYQEFLQGQAFAARYPGVQVAGIIEVVRDARRGDAVRRIRADATGSGLPYPSFVLRPEGRRPDYGVVSYLYPIEENAPAFGLDAFTRPGRRDAVLRARDTARVAAPPPDLLVQEEDSSAQAVLVMLPLYRGLDQTPEPADRPGRFLGVAYLGVRLPDLLRGLVDPARGEDLEVRDAGRLIYDARGASDARRDGERRGTGLRTAGRPWEVIYATTEPRLARAERAVPWLIGLLGLVVSLLAGAVVQSMTSATRRAQALADRMTEDLRRSNEDLERFAFLASHDLQQPLRTITGFLQLLERQSGERLDDRGREYVDFATRGAMQMSTLIDNLLAYARVARDERPLEPVSLDEAWDTAEAQLHATIEQHGASVSRGSLPVVLGDPGQLAQVFGNLIGNAVKYRGETPPRVRAEARRVDGAWEVEVADNGIGIDPSQHDRIFEMFSRLHTDDDVEGTGVGLALARRIVERFGGTLSVRSRPGEGSRFVLRLPRGSA